MKSKENTISSYLGPSKPKIPPPILMIKYTISTPLIIENPVRRPMVPPIADNISTGLAALSLVTLSNVGVSKKILTYLNFDFVGGSEIFNINVVINPHDTWYKF